MSYLGKISALVTVNTGDFAPKLNAAAKEVRSFARQVESNIGSSMRTAAKSFADIYTPLQKFERSMQAARSMKLSFGGFAGAIKDIDTLKQRLTSLSSRQVEVVLKTTGMKDITTFRDAIYGLQSRQFDLMVKVGGAERLEEIGRVLSAGGSEFEVVVQTQQAMAKVQSLRKEVDTAKAAAADVTVAVDTTAVDSAREKVRRATQELLAYTTRTSEGTITEPKQLREEALTQRVAVGNRIDAMKAGKAKAASVQAAEEEYRQLSKVIKDLSALQRQKRQAEKELSAAEQASTPGAGIKAMERDLRAAERAYKELVQEAQKKIVAQFGVQMDVKDVESLLDGSAAESTRRLQAAFEAAGMSAGEAATRIKQVMEELGRSDLDATAARMRQMISATESITKPFNAAKDALAGMSATVQAGFLPALAQAQDEIEQLQDAINRDDGPAAVRELEAMFAALERKVKANVEAIGRLSEASAKLSQLKTGNELQFAAPRLSAALDRGAQIGNAAAELPQSAIQRSPQIAQGLVEINDLSNKAVAAYAKLQVKQAEGLPTTASRRELDKLLDRLRAVQDAAEEEINLHVDTAESDRQLQRVRSQIQGLREAFSLSGTGLVQTFEQARAQVDRLVAKFNSLDSSGQSQVRGEINSLISGMEANPGQFDAEAIRRVELLVSSLEKASDSTRSLRSEMASIAAGVAPPSAPVDLLRRSLAEARKAIDQLDGPARAAGERNLRRIATYIDNNKGDEAAALRAAQAAEGVRSEAEQVASRPTVLPVGYFQDQMRRSAQAELGGGLGSLDRQLGRFGSSIVAVKSQLTILPEEVRSHFIPAIQAADQEFVRLRVLGVHATAEEIERANNNMRVLEASAKRATTAFNFRSSMGGANAQEFELNLQGRSLTGYQAQLQILQQALGRVSSEARGPAAASFLALQDAISTAFQNGTLDSRTTRAEIQRLTADAVQATARVANIGVGTLGRQVARAGDVGRRGFDNLSLAINQGAFAIDDFLSSTGGLEFKLRAVSNNITQMAFILGGTTGLFIGLGAVIAGQVAVGLIKWANGGRTAEDVTKALNDALARQKSLVEELTQAFRSLGDTIGRQAFSAPAQQAREFQNQLADIIRKQRELSRARVADVDVGVQRERATQNRLSRELEKEEDPRRRVALSRQLEESRANERRFAAAAAATEAPTGQDVANYLNRVIDRYEIVARNLREGVEAGTIIPSAGEVAAMGLPDNLRREMQGMPVGGDATSITKQLETLRAAQDFLKPIGTETIMGFQTPMARQANAALQQIEELTQRLQAVALDKAFIEAAKNIIEGSNRAARFISSAQQDVADAIRRGVPAAVDFQVQLDRMGAELQAANDALAAAQEMDPGERRTAAVERAQARVADVEARRTEIEASARAARLGRGFGGERTTSALSRLQGNDRFENERAGLTARVRAAVDNELVARRRLEASQEQEAQRRKAVVDAELAVSNAATDAEKAAAQEALNAATASEAAATASREKAQADAEAAAKASDLVASLAEFALSVEQTIARLRKIGDSAIQRSEGGADAAQRALEEGRGTAVARDAAERNLIADRERLAKANNALNTTRSEAMNSPEMQAIRQERERVESELKDIEAKNAEAMANNGAVPGEGLAAAQARQDRLAELARQEAEVMDEVTRKRREELDAIAKSITARERELERGRKRDEEGNEFNRQRGMVDEAVSAAERRRDEADKLSDIAPSDENMDRLRIAERELFDARERQQQVRDEIDEIERLFNERGDIQKARDEIAANEGERAALIAKDASGSLTPEERLKISSLEEKNVRLRGNIAFERKEAVGDISFELRKRQLALDAADRGRELGMGERERVRRDMETGAGFEIRARAEQIKSEIRRIEDLQAMGASTEFDDKQLEKLKSDGGVDGFIRQALANQMEQIAPMLAQFQQERDTAMLQGPSRAALQVSDVTTSQGMSELNRLLRGDDPSKDVNLSELKKQTGLFEELINVVKNNPLPVI